MSIFKQLIKSIYSPKDIAKFRYQGIGKTILYIFLLAFIMTIPAAIYFSTGISKGVDAAKTIVTEEFSSFKIDNGTLTTTNQKPVIIQKEGFSFIMDGTGEITAEDMQDYPNAIGLLKNKAIFVTANQPQEFNYSMLDEMTITNKDIEAFINTFHSMLPVIIPLILLFVFIFSAGIKFIEVTFFALIALLIKRTMNQKIRFRHAWVITAYSITLATMFFTIMDLFMITVPYGLLLTWFVHTTVIYLSIKEF